MASLRKVLLLAALAGLPAQPQIAVTVDAAGQPSAEEEAPDLTSADWEAKFKWLDINKGYRGAFSEAARHWPPVNKMTLGRKYKLYQKGADFMAAVGRPPTFEEATEKVLVDLIEVSNKGGHPLTTSQLKRQAIKLAEACGATKGATGVGSDGWVRGFQKRHKDLFKVNASLLETERAHAVTRAAIERYFDIAEIGLDGIVAPELIFFMDESHVDMHARTRIKVCQVHPKLYFAFSPNPLHHFPLSRRCGFATKTRACTVLTRKRTSTFRGWAA